MVPTFKTVEAKVLFSDKEISSGDEDRKNIFVLNKGNKEFIKKVNDTPDSGSAIQSNTGTSEIKDKVQKYCDTLKGKSSDFSNIAYRLLLT